MHRNVQRLQARGEQTMAQSIIIRPSIFAQSEAFKNGYDLAQRNDEGNIGWPIQYAPTEQTIIQFLKAASDILTADNWDDFEARWIGGLLAGWMSREVPYTSTRC